MSSQVSSIAASVAAPPATLPPSSAFHIHPPAYRLQRRTKALVQTNSVSGGRLLRDVRSSRTTLPWSIQNAHQSPAPILPSSSCKLSPSDADNYTHVGRPSASTVRKDARAMGRLRHDVAQFLSADCEVTAIVSGSLLWLL